MTRIRKLDPCHPRLSASADILYGLGGGGALRRDPEFDGQLISWCTDQRHDASFIESSRVNEIFDNAARMMLDVTAFARSSRIDDHVRRRCRIVLQFDREVVESRLLVVARNIRKLVKLAAVEFRQWNRDRTVSGALERVATH